MGKDKKYDWSLGPDELPVCLKDMTLEELEVELKKEEIRCMTIDDPSKLEEPPGQD